MRTAIASLMLANAVLFALGAIQHAGVALGPLHEPVILPARIVETCCAIALILGVVAILARLHWARGAVIAANLVAIAGVTVGMIALAAGRGPRTASNDLSHRCMLTLAGAALVASLVSGVRRADRRS